MMLVMMMVMNVKFTMTVIDDGDADLDRCEGGGDDDGDDHDDVYDDDDNCG